MGLMLYIAPETLAYLREYSRSAKERARIRLACEPAPKPRQLSKHRFDPLVEAMGRVLAEGMPTQFRHEGTCRQAVRVALIRGGWGWSDADREALRVVGAALAAIGAQRPSWMQARPEYREGDQTNFRYRHCMTCGGMLENQQAAGRHCSSECARVTAKKTWARENRDRMNALTKAWAAANPEKRKAIRIRQIERADPRDCQHCGKTFRVENSQKDKFCAPACGYAARSAAAAKRNEKQCDFCFDIFVARSRRGRSPNRKHYCSRVCSVNAKRHGATTIFQCEETA